MNKLLAARIERLEADLKAFSRSRVWVDMIDNRVRIDIGGKRGEEVTFDNVLDCLLWVEMQVSQFENVTGMVCIDDVSELLEGSARELFNDIHEGMPFTGVWMSLNGRNNESLVMLAVVSWWHSLSGVGFLEWRQQVAARIDALFQSMDGPEPEPMFQ